MGWWGISAASGPGKGWLSSRSFLVLFPRATFSVWPPCARQVLPVQRDDVPAGRDVQHQRALPQPPAQPVCAVQLLRKPPRELGAGALSCTQHCPTSSKTPAGPGSTSPCGDGLSLGSGYGCRRFTRGHTVQVWVGAVWGGQWDSPVAAKGGTKFGQEMKKGQKSPKHLPVSCQEHTHRGYIG